MHKLIVFFKKLLKKGTLQLEEKKDINTIQKSKDTFSNDIKFRENIDNTKFLQKSLENKTITINNLSNEQIKKINDLYITQIDELNKEIRTNDLEILHRIKKYGNI